MIRCTLELLPGGFEDNARTLGVIYFENDLVDSLETGGARGSYRVRIFKKRQGRKPWKRLRITDYPRKAYHPWELVYRTLKEALHE